MKFNKKILFIIIAVVALLAMIVFISTCKKKVPNRFTFPSTMVVNNNTEYPYADTISMVILNKIYSLDTMKINIYYSPIDFSTNDIEVVGFIKKNIFEPHSYMFFLKKPPISIPISEFLSHELIHLKQMEDGELIELGDYNIYKNDTIYLNKVKYENRPYEIYAFKHQGDVRKKLKKLLYSK